MEEKAITVRSVAEEISALRGSLDSLERLVGLEHRYIQRMQERDRLYRLVLDSTRDWIICFDQQGMVTDANQAVAQALSCNEYDLVGRRVHELRLQRRVADSWELCRRAATKPDAFIQHEVQGVFPDGNTYTLHTFFRPIDDSRGNIVGVIMVGRDAAGGTPSVQPSARTVDLEHALYQEFAGIAYRGDPGQRFSSLFGRVEEITGYRTDELLEINWENLIHPDDRPGVQAAYQLFLTAPELALDQEYRILTKDGGWRYVREVVRSLLNPAGTPVAAEGIIQDISSRKAAEQTLDELANLLRLITNAGPEAVQVLRPGVVAIDEALQRAVGGNGTAVCYQRLGQTAPCSRCAALLAGASRKTETCLVKAAAEVFECAAHPVLDERGQVKLIVQHLSEITQRMEQIERTETELQRLALLLDNLPQSVLLVAADHRIQYMNAAGRMAIGDHTEHFCYQLLGKSEPCAACPLAPVFAGEAADQAYRLCSYGRELQGHARGHREADGSISALLILDDVTAAAQSERQTGYYQLISGRQRDVVLVADLDGNILEANRAATEIYGHSREALLHLKLTDLGDMAGILGVPTDEELTAGLQIETMHRRQDGSIFPVEVSAEWAVVDERLVTVSLVKDISRQKAELQAALFNSMHDALTGLYNRGYLERIADWLQQEGNYPLSLIMGDVNGLKLANDAFGYAAGDGLIQAVARAIQANCLRASDIAVRFGGDEFVLILPATDASEAAQICERVRQAAANVGHTPVAPSAAWGIATAVEPGQPLALLIKQAEERMQKNKLLDSQKTRVEIVASLHQRLQRQACETPEHTDRVQQLALGLGQLLELSEDDLQRLSQLALLHDLGKVAIPESILLKPERLTKEEWLLMQRHPEIGYRIASSIPELMQISDEILGHHERWDGTGYPRRLRGEEIPLLARIIAVADAYTVMTGGRPYRAALSPSAAAGELVRCAGTQFDPRLVRLFVNQHGLAEAAAAIGQNS